MHEAGSPGCQCPRDEAGESVALLYDGLGGVGGGWGVKGVHWVPGAITHPEVRFKVGSPVRTNMGTGFYPFFLFNDVPEEMNLGTGSSH